MDDEIQDSNYIFAELAKVKSTPMKLELGNDVDSGHLHSSEDEIQPTEEGQLTIDVFQDADHIYVQSAVAGVDPDDLDVNITKESVTIRGKRERIQKVEDEDYFYQECFWGSFSRSVVLPQAVDPDKSSAALKNGVLTVKMPRFDRKKGRKVKIKTST